MKIATWNVNSLRVRLAQTLRWLEHSQVDILGLQETKLPDEDFPVEAFREAGYEPLYSGQRAYNGVAVLARRSGRDVVTDLPQLEDSQRRLLAASYDGLRIVNLYVPNGQRVGTEKFQYKLAWLEALEQYLRGERDRHQRLLVMGDYNIAPADEDVHDPALWEGAVLCSEPERAALRRLETLGLEDAFRLFPQEAQSFSWWDYRAGAFRRNRGLRIDLILASSPLARLCRRCYIDREPRAWERPSDHAPVVAEFEL